MIDTGTIGLGVSAVVGLIQLLGYLHTKATRKEVSLDKFAQAANVAAELTVIRDDIHDIIRTLHEYGAKISTIQSDNAVCTNKHEHTADDINAQFVAMEKLLNKIEALK